MKEPIYQKIREYLLRLIEENKDKKNFKLPSENQLAIKFGASRICAKRALGLLEAENYIYRMQGKGSFINENRGSARPPEYAKSGRAARRRQVALIIPSLASEFIIALCYYINTRFLERDIVTSLYVTNQRQDLESQIIREAVQFGVSGLIIFPVDNEKYSYEILKLTLNDFPVVILDRKLTGLNLNMVASAHFESAYDVTRLLLKKGLRRIYFLSPQAELPSSARERLDGFKAAFIDCKTLYDKDLEVGVGPDRGEYAAILDRLVGPRGDAEALILPSGATALVLREIFAKYGEAARDPVVVFYDNEQASFEVLGHKKTLILQQNTRELGTAAADCLYQKIRGEAAADRTVPFAIVNAEAIDNLMKNEE